MNVKRIWMVVLTHVLTLRLVITVLVILVIDWQMIVMDVMVSNYDGE